MTTRTHVATEVESELRRRLSDKRGKWAAMDKLPTVRELAEEFDVSPSTLDKILRKLKYEGMIRSHQGKGYFRVDGARATKTHTVGVLIYNTSHIDHPIMLQRLAGIQKTLFDASYHVKLFSLNPDAVSQSVATASDALPVDTRSVDAVINHCELIGQERLHAMARHCPVVCTEWPVRGPGIACVRHDYAGGAVLLARHLYERGHRRLGLVTVDDSIISANRQAEGMRLGLLGTEARLAIERADDWTPEAGVAAGRRWLASARRETVLVCGSDELAVGVHRALKHAGVRVPRDVALTSWNNTSMTEEIPVPLTTIRMPYQRGGQVCAAEALRLIANPEAEGCDELLPAELVIRESTPPLRV